MFPIFSVPSDAAELSEQMGTKFKFWYEDPLRGLTLFKEGRPGTGENWAEKIACELALMLGIPHAYYDFGEWNGKAGVLSPSFVPEAGRLIHGNELIGGKVAKDQEDATLRVYHQRSHTAAAVLGLLRLSTTVQLPWQAARVEGIASALHVFVGYLLFDTWIANQDRHSENWGLVRLRDVFYLAPSFDHGSSLARNLTDEDRQYRMTTKDKGAAIQKYVTTARSALYPLAPLGEKVKALSTIDAFHIAWKMRPEAGRIWLGRLAAIPAAIIKDTIEGVPSELMSDLAKEFTLRLLEANRNRLLALKL
jgi:hypothetical protein